jgi:uncharacterized protein (DUF1800 family)
MFGRRKLMSLLHASERYFRRGRVAIILFTVLLLLWISGCATVDDNRTGNKTIVPAETAAFAATPTAHMQLLNRITWGATPSLYNEIAKTGSRVYLEKQLKPSADDGLPADVQTQIDALTITQKPMDQLLSEMTQKQKDSNAIKNDDEKKKAQQDYQKELSDLSRQAAIRSVYRALYSQNQLQEQMVWFWMNHFSVHAQKHMLRAMMGDYENNAIRPFALGKFRDMLAATVYHPAMLQYLDNFQNAGGKINENYARELMELHTLGVDGGYSQKDVQELARILTGLGVNFTADKPKVRANLESQYVRRGAFEFNPMRHDYTDKVLLGQTIKGSGLAEVEQAIQILSRHPSTAKFVSRKLATFFVSDDPPAALIERMAKVFLESDGDIATTLRSMFYSQEFANSMGKKFKSPIHYAISGVRAAYDTKPILNPAPVMGWLGRMGQSLYGRETPDGYSLTQTAWSSPGQMTTRFEIARAIGSSNAGLFKGDGATPRERPAFPQMANALFYQALAPLLTPPTRQALDQAVSPQEWNTFLLASPEFMYR